MAVYFPAFWAVGVSLSQALEKTRDPWLVTSAAFLILLALTYLASVRARYAIELRLAVKKPTTLNRWLGCLLLILPGALILATVYYPGKTTAVEQQSRPKAILKQQRRELAALVRESRRSGPTPRRAAFSPAANVRERVADQSRAVEAEGSASGNGTQTPPRARRVAAVRKGELRAKAQAESVKSEKAARKLGRNIWFTKGGHIAAATIGELDSAVQFLKEKDLDSFQRLEAAQRAVILKDGLKVKITEYDYVGGKVRVQMQGTTVQFWTFKEALTKG